MTYDPYGSSYGDSYPYYSSYSDPSDMEDLMGSGATARESSGFASSTCSWYSISSVVFIVIIVLVVLGIRRRKAGAGGPSPFSTGQVSKFSRPPVNFRGWNSPFAGYPSGFSKPIPSFIRAKGGKKGGGGSGDALEKVFTILEFLSNLAG